MKTIPILVRAATILLTACLAAALAACQGPIGPVTPSSQITQYFPQIESVDYPSEVIVNQSFDLTFTLSTDADPSVLTAADMIWRALDGSPDYFIGRDAGTYQQGVFVGPVLVHEGYKLNPTDPGGPAGTEYVHTVTFNTTGTKYLYVQGVANGAQGGLKHIANYSFSYPYPLGSSQFEVIELQIEVFPAP